MDSTEETIPWLSPDQLANAHTRVVINGLEWELWQVGHSHGLNHPTPSPGARTGASARHVRERYSQQRNQEAASSHNPLDSHPARLHEGQPRPNAPTIPSSRPTHVQPTHAQSVDSDGHGISTHELLRLIDELIDEGYCELEENITQEATFGSTWTLPSTPSTARQCYWQPFPLPSICVDSSFPPPLHPPPKQPLPPLPPKTASARPLEETSVLTSATAARFARLAGNTDSGSGQTQTAPPATSRRQLLVISGEEAVAAATRRRQHVATPRQRSISPLAAQQQPVAMPQERAIMSRATSRQQLRQPPTGVGVENMQTTDRYAKARAPPASILRNRRAESYDWQSQEDARPAESQRKPQPSLLPYPVPDFQQNPPEFLKHPPDLSQQPSYDEPAGMIRTRVSPLVSKLRFSSSPFRPLRLNSSQQTDQDRQAEASARSSQKRSFSAAKPPNSGHLHFPQQPTSDSQPGMMGATATPRLNKSRSAAQLVRPVAGFEQTPPIGLTKQSGQSPQARMDPESRPRSETSTTSSSNQAQPLPSVFNHPPDLPQRPTREQRAGPSTKADPVADPSSSQPNRVVSEPSPTTPTADDVGLPKSHWSESDSDDSPKLTRMQRVKRVLSFARLRSKKSQAFQSQGGEHAGKSFISGGKRTSRSSGANRTRADSEGRD